MSPFVKIRKLLLAVICLATVAASSAQQPAVNQDALRLQEFENSVQSYMKLREKVKPAETAKPSSSADKITQQKQQLATSIRRARTNAKQGDIFSPGIAPVFERLLAGVFHSSDGSATKKSLQRGEPVHALPLRINGAYPEHVPLQNMPPSLLGNLPQLPKQLEYRIVGRSLVLRDTDANMIVDYLPDALPAGAALDQAKGGDK